MPRAGVGVAVASILAIVAVAAVAGRQAPVRASPLHDIAFDFRTKQPIVPVRVNDGAAVPFVVDTGASIHLLDRGVAAAARAAHGTAGPLAGGGAGTQDVRWVDGLTMATGELRWSGQRAAVADLGYPDRKHFGGLLGAPVLTRYTVQLAFPAQRLRLFDPAAYAPPRGAIAVPFELQADLPVVRATIDAGAGPIEARLMVDTGASTFLDLNRPFVDAHGLVETLPDAKASERPAALGGTAPFLYGTAARVVLAGQVFERPRIGLSRATSGSSSRSERDGIIGNELLRGYVMTVDYRRKTIFLERAALPSRPPG